VATEVTNPSTNESEAIHCALAGRCGGCPWIQIPVSEQRQKKISEVSLLEPQKPVQVVSVGEQRLRDRVDLTLIKNPGEPSQIGLWSLQTSGPNAPSGPRELVDLKECPMMSEELETWFKEFREDLPPVAMGSVRLRISPTGERGVWLDLSHQDVKTLMDEKEYFTRLLQKAHVEIGQRKKPLRLKDGELKLEKKMDFKPWFWSWDENEKVYPLLGPIGGFTQSGRKANKALVGEVLKSCRQSGDLLKLDHWVEAFCGSGNFTYPLSQSVERVLAFENDRQSLEALEEGLEKNQISNVKLMAVDAKSKRQMEEFHQELQKWSDYGLLADPPRSGLMKLLDEIKEQRIRPKALVYVSCSAPSLLKDGEQLKKLGYKLQTLALVDQFVHSPHVEWVSLWTL
tara:strand:- start:4479 stop:5675 length:1197 start_codon:yes stop_codon:yes gene_type:complete